MVYLENRLVEENVLTKRFMCDLTKCKGACCTMPGDCGAPLKEEELEPMRNALEIVSKYLPERALKEIAENNFYIEMYNEIYTTVINDRDCVFVYYDGDIAFCALEKAYFAGEIEFRKPISCHLYPIRSTNYGAEYLYFSEISECKPAIKKGEKENIPLFNCVKSALERAYGVEWTLTLKTAVEEHIKSKID